VNLNNNHDTRDSGSGRGLIYVQIFATRQRVAQPLHASSGQYQRREAHSVRKAETRVSHDSSIEWTLILHPDATFVQTANQWFEAKEKPVMVMSHSE
jgi:hypothetical protein